MASLKTGVEPLQTTRPFCISKAASASSLFLLWRLKPRMLVQTERKTETKRHNNKYKKLKLIKQRTDADSGCARAAVHVPLWLDKPSGV